MLDILQLFSVGDLIDKKLINSIKIEKIGTSPRLEEENKKIDDLINLWFPKHKKELKRMSDELRKILVRQWNILDISMDDTNSIDKRSRFAMKAQVINFERVRWKNEINELCGSSHEVKKYGTKEI